MSETSWLVRPCWYHAQGCHEACAAVDAEVATLRRQLSEARRALEGGLRLLGGWREAVTELEDFCSEPVRLKNMMAAADQMDHWKVEARAFLASTDQPQTHTEGK